MEIRALTKKQHLFADHVATGLSLTDAYYAAGYRPAKRFTASCLASRLRAHPLVAAHLTALQRIARKKSIARLRSKVAALDRLIRLDVTTLSRAERKRYGSTARNGDEVIRLPDKLEALRLHSKLLGHFDLV